MSERKTIGISMGCFYYWTDNHPQWISEQLRLLDTALTFVQRVELHFSVDDLLALNDDHTSQYQEKLNNVAVSIHFPKLSSESDTTIITLLEKLSTLATTLNAEYSVIHSDDFAKLDNHQTAIITKMRVGLENSDIRKNAFQHLKDLEAFLPLPVILDIDHIEEMQSRSLGSEMSSLKNSVLGVHFSTPKNPYITEHYPYIKTTHFPFTRGDTTPPKNIPKNVPIIIEGVIPKNEPDIIQEEVTIIEKQYSSSMKKDPSR